MAKLAQQWTVTSCSKFTGNDEWPPITFGELNTARHFIPSQRTR